MNFISPTYYPVVLPAQNEATTRNIIYENFYNMRKHHVKSLLKSSMLTLLQHPPLLEEICSLLPQQLRREMIRYGMERKLTNAGVFSAVNLDNVTTFDSDTPAVHLGRPGVLSQELVPRFCALSNPG